MFAQEIGVNQLTVKDARLRLRKQASNSNSATTPELKATTNASPQEDTGMISPSATDDRPAPAVAKPPAPQRPEFKSLSVNLCDDNPAVMARKFASYASQQLGVDFYRAFIAELNDIDN